MTDIRANLDSGRIPFVPCPHDGDEFSPAHALTTALTFLITCVICSKVHAIEAVTWATPQEAQERFGWRVMDADSPPPPSDAGLHR